MIKVTVYRKYELEITEEQIKEEKENYAKNPDFHFLLSDELEFIDYLDANYVFTIPDDTIINKNDFDLIKGTWERM